MIRYYSKTGVELSRLKWLALLRDPKYTVCREDFVGPGVRLRTCWVGMCVTPGGPELFVTEVGYREKESFKDGGLPVWSLDQVAANKAHERMLEQLREAFRG